MILVPHLRLPAGETKVTPQSALPATQDYEMDRVKDLSHPMEEIISLVSIDRNKYTPFWLDGSTGVVQTHPLIKAVSKVTTPTGT